jgi:cytochrome b561
LSGLVDFNILITLIYLNFGVIICGWALSEIFNSGLSSINLLQPNTNNNYLQNSDVEVNKKLNWINFIFFGLLYSLTIIIILFSFLSLNENEKTNFYFKWIVCSVITIQYVIHHIVILFRFLDIQLEIEPIPKKQETSTRALFPMTKNSINQDERLVNSMSIPSF